jgi:hypothetical protein
MGFEYFWVFAGAETFEVSFTLRPELFTLSQQL